jgi:CheY-like chemotaxis protein
MKQVMIVDDSLEMGRWLQTALMQGNPEIQARVVPSAEEALLEASRRPVDLLVVDIRLPGMTGVELVTKVRARFAMTRVIFITGVADSKLKKQAEELKPDAFFNKPIEIPAFVEAVSASLNLVSLPPVPQPAATKATVIPEPVLPLVANLPGVLTGLREDLSALAVILLDDRGHVMAQTGEFPEPSFESLWIAPLMASVSSTNKVSRLLGRPQVEGALVLRGLTFDLVLAPADNFSLVVVVQPGRTNMRLLLAFEAVLGAQGTLQSILNSMRVPLVVPDIVPLPKVSPAQPAVTPAPAEAEPDLAKFEQLLNASAASTPKDVDAFWDQASSGTKVNPNPGAISYDQARKLGLTPDQPDESGKKPKK